MPIESEMEIEKVKAPEGSAPALPRDRGRARFAVADFRCLTESRYELLRALGEELREHPRMMGSLRGACNLASGSWKSPAREKERSEPEKFMKIKQISRSPA